MVAPIAVPQHEAGVWKSRVGLSPAGTVSLAAIVAVLVFVSLARLRPLMTHENEVDARQTVELLAAQLEEWSGRPGNRSLVPALEELAQARPVLQALSDGTFEEQGRILKRHGYLFCVVELPPPPPRASEPGTVLAAEPALTGAAPQLGIRAWPWKHGSSGRVALVGTARGRLFRHANRTALWSGPQGSRKAMTTWAGWVEL